MIPSKKFRFSSSFNDLKRKKIKEISREGNISIEMEKVSGGQDKFGTFPWVIEREREREKEINANLRSRKRMIWNKLY